MDWRQIKESVSSRSPSERVARFALLDRWFADNPAAATSAVVGGPSGVPVTAIDRGDLINERQALAFQIARDAVMLYG